MHIPGAPRTMTDRLGWSDYGLAAGALDEQMECCGFSILLAVVRHVENVFLLFLLSQISGNPPF